MKMKLLLLSAICMVSFVSCNSNAKKTEEPAPATVTETVQPEKKKTVIVARVKVKDGKEADFLKIALPLVEATNKEAGNLYYELYQSPRDAKTFIFYEEYVDDAAFEAHGSSAHFKQFAEAVPDLVAEEMTIDKF